MRAARAAPAAVGATRLRTAGAARAARIFFKILDGTPKKMFKILGEPLTPKSKKCEFLVVKESTLGFPNP